MNNINQNQTQDQSHGEEEIDLIELALKLWKKRIFIIKIAAIAAAVGVVVALTSPVEYTSSSSFVPQVSGGSSSGGSLSSLAKLAGVSLGSGGSSSGSLSPMVYPNVMNNIKLQKELINTPFFFEEYGKNITLLDYYTSEEYQKFSIKKYTIGLPFLILGAIRGEETKEDNSVGEADQSLQFYTEEEASCVEVLKGAVSLNIDDKNGYVSITATMPSAITAAQVVNRVQELLQNYVTEFKIEKALIEYEFINDRYNEVKSDFEQKQMAYAKFKDSNKILTSATSQILGTTLQSEYELARSTFNELAVQLVQAEIKIKEDTPIFTVIEPSKVPNQRSAPRRSLILMAFTFLGGVIGCGIVLLSDFVKTIKLPEDEVK